MTDNMSTATLANEARRNVALFSATPNRGSFRMFRRQDHATGNQVLTLKGVPVFRSGTFRDSMGIQHTWEDMHMSQMVDNFELLLSRGIMPGAPVRKGHNGFFTSGSDTMDGLIGWHTGLTTATQTNPVDHGTYTYLLADYDILDPDAANKIENGLWKSLSAEVGDWTSNSEAEYWPVYQGVAYVDFPAVEGLTKFASANGVGKTFSIMVSDKEISVGHPISTEGTPGTGTPTPPPLPPVPPQAQPGQQTSAPGTQTAPEGQHTAPAAQPQQPAPANGPAPANTFTFTLSNGQTTTDFARVQADLAALSAFKKESIEMGRKSFVEGLVKSNKLLAPNQAATEAFALSLSDEQFTAYRAQWEGVPVSPVVGQQHAGATNTDTQPEGHNTGASTPSEVDILVETVHAFSVTGMTPEQIKRTNSFRALQAKAPDKVAALGLAS